MVNSKQSYNTYNSNNPNKGATPKAGTWVPGGKTYKPHVFKNEQPTAANVGLKNKQGIVLSEEKIFRRNQRAIDVMKALFILEGEEKFENKTLRNKMTMVAKEGEKDFVDWFYERGVTNSLPDTWEDFKIAVIEYCTDSGLESLKKFGEEKWSEYVRRVREYVSYKAYPTIKAWKKLQNDNVPKEIKFLFFDDECDLGKLEQNLVQWEMTAKCDARETGELKHTTFSKQKRCYFCQKLGHISKDCFSRKKADDTSGKEFNMVSSNQPRNRHLVTLNDKENYAILDTGADTSLISADLLQEFPKGSIKTCPRKIYTLVNGNKINVDRQISLRTTLQGKTRMINYGVLENGRQNIVIVGRDDLKFEITRSKNIPIECAIDTKGAGPISWNRPIRSAKDKEDFEILVRRLKDEGIVEESQATWLNPVVLVRKKDGTMRFCVDFRKLNDLVDLDRFEIPKISEMMHILHGAKYFGSIDLKDGFFQIPLRKDDRDKTTFFTGSGLYRFRKMPQGYKNSPAIFQRAMTIILGELLGKICLCYIDDILIFSKSEREHEENMFMVREKLIEYGLTENRDKTIEKACEITFLGYRINHNKITPTESRSQGIVAYVRPKTKKQLQRFLGMANYDRLFIEKLSCIAKPLYDLLGKESKFEWGKAQEEAFNNIKENWARKLELYIPNLSKTFELETDASKIGIGAVLRQNNQPVAYISRTLTKTEQNYGITEREMLAALWAMEKFRYFLEGKEFRLVTDHKALEELKNNAEFGKSKFSRWFERLQKFQFKVIYKKGQEMIASDALSRGVEKGEMVNPIEENLDDRIMKVHIESGHRKDISNMLIAKGINESKYRVDEILKSCLECLKHDPKHYKIKGFVQTTRPGELIGVDILHITDREKVLVAIDYFTRYVYAQVITTKQASKVIEFLKKLKVNLEIKSLRLDNGKEFNNKYVKEWANENQVNLQFSVPYVHESNGRVERVNRTIRNAIRKSKGQIKVVLSKVVNAYNKSIHRGTGFTPEDGMLEANWEKMRIKQEEYAKEFGSDKTKARLSDDTRVLIRNENTTSKMAYKYDEEGKVKSYLGNGVNLVEPKKGGPLIKRHTIQLKPF